MTDLPPELHDHADVKALVAHDGDVVLTRDRSSGKVHRRVRLGTGLATLEGDNLDQAGDFEVITPIEFERVEADALCRRCFPNPNVADAE